MYVPQDRVNELRFSFLKSVLHLLAPFDYDCDSGVIA